MSLVAEKPHVTLSGDVVGDYVVTEERPGGVLLLTPDSARQTQRARPATAEEFAAFEAEYGPFLPPDGEG